MDLTPDQINQLNSLGIDVKKESLPVKNENLDIGNLKLKNKHPKADIFPLLSISGLTILSFSGLILLKSKNQNTTSPSTIDDLPSIISPSPTQVPKSIQHYLLTSQQFFSSALQKQNSTTTDDQLSTIEDLNKSILAATQAIKEFPQDYRGYQQRGQIYQSLINSKPELIDQSISDIATAQKLNNSSAEITRTLASLYAKKGDAQNTILYLNQTVTLEPTKAQNFYDLAKIQQQVGLLPQALETYNKLITLVTDSTQKAQIESEKSTIEKIISENPNLKNVSPSTTDELSPTISVDSPTIQATDITNNTGLIIAAPEEGNKIQVTNQTDSNSLSGNSTLLTNQKEISIENNNLKSTSQVYITVTKGGKNQNLKVLSKSEKSFVVGLDSPISEDIEFKWWIIN
jgi:tetratricopeptide (TPR) repeat protein